MSEPLISILIVGGGTAGWMAACALNQALRHTPTRVALVESEDIGTVGVGEATVPTIRDFNRSIGLNEIDFMKATQGTFKLGIEFRNWRSENSRFFHGFGDYVVNEGPFSTLNQWLIARNAIGEKAGQLDDYHMAAVMAYATRFAAPVNDPRSPLHYFSYAFHFDAGLYAKLLSAKAQSEGVIRHEGKITDVTQNPESGFIESVTLSDGRILEADLYIDCSGFVALLADKTLHEPYIDYSHWLPVDRAWAAPCESAGALLPYTRATALEAGWQWRIPLQHRTGNGYVFSSAHISEDAARERLVQGLDGQILAEPRLLKFKTGRREQFWTKNCVAIGLSSGFVEPLESTSISLIQGGITRLVTMLPDMDFKPQLAKEYNRVQALEFDRIRDFIIAHYALSERGDAPFWRDMRHMALPDTLQHKIETFRETGLLSLLNEETFVTASWHSIFIGLGLLPARLDPILRSEKTSEILRGLELRRSSLKQAAEQLPSHADFIYKNCKA